MYRRYLGISLILLWFLAGIALSQPAGKITGTVIDVKTKEPLPGANIRILASNRGTAADDRGYFELDHLPAGKYVIEASVIGYEPQQFERELQGPESRIHLEFELLEKPLLLQDVVVTPGHFAIMRQEPATRQTMTREDIRSVPQFGEDIYRAVKRLPGVSGSDFSARFNVRGGENEEVLVLLDGLELYEPFHLKDINGGALSIIDVEAIGGINMMTGGFPAEFGDRLSGVFNIDSAKPAHGQSRTALGLSFTNARILTEGAFAGEKGHWLFSVRRGYLDLIMPIVDPQSDFRPQYYDLLGKAQYRLSHDHVLALNILRAGDDLNLTEDDNDGDTVSSNYGNSYGWMTLKSFPSSDLLVQTVLSAGRVNSGRRGTDFAGANSVRAHVQDQRSFDVFGVKQDWNLEVGKRQFLKWGIDYRRFEADYDYFNRERILISVDANGAVFDYDTTAARLAPAGHELGGYVADRIRLTNALTTELGLRYDANSYTGDNKLSPRVNLAYALGERSMLRLGWGRFYQSQGINELEVQDGDFQFYPAELAEHRVAGFEHHFDNGILLRLEGYQKKLSHLRPRYMNLTGQLEFFPEIEGDRIRLDPERGESKGIEIFVKRESDGPFEWWLSYGLARVTDEIDGLDIRRSFDQRHTVYADLSYRPSTRWRINMAWQYHSGWPITERTIEKVTQDDGSFYYRSDFGELNGSEYPAFHRLDLKINRYWQFDNSRVSVFLEVTNLYNRSNVREYYFDTVTRPEGELEFVRKSDRWLPLLPSVGVSVEF